MTEWLKVKHRTDVAVAADSRDSSEEGIAHAGKIVLPAPIIREAADILEHGPLDVIGVPTTQPPSTPGRGFPDDSREGYIAVPEPPTLGPDLPTVWHYTDAVGALGILTSNELWASHLDSLNDLNELKWGRDTLAALIEKIERSCAVASHALRYIHWVAGLADELVERGGLYFLSASADGFSLSQWRMYGGNQPYVLGLDASSPLGVVGSTVRDVSPDRIRPVWHRVLYSVAEQELLLRSVLSYLAFLAPADDAELMTDETHRAHALVLVRALVHCKDPSFISENEVRMVFQPGASSLPAFRVSRFGIGRHLRISGATQAGSFDSTDTLLPVTSVVVGPFASRESSGAATVALIKQLGYGRQTTVLLSNSGYR